MPLIYLIIFKLFEENKEIYFSLLLQKLIEFIKKNEIETALEFAQNDLLPFLNTSSQNNDKNVKKNWMNINFFLLFFLRLAFCEEKTNFPY